MHETWPLVGRAEELGVVQTFLESDDHGLILGGPAGVGKTRMLHEALALAEARGATIRRAVGTASAQPIPLSAFASWVTPSSGDDLRLVRSVIDGLTRGDDVIVAVDDAHLLDDLSVFVLNQIAQRGDVKLVHTVRAREPVPLALQESWTCHRFRRIELQPLSPEEANSLVRSALGGPLNLDAGQRLWRLTQGNPLYLRNIVEHEVRTGRLTSRDGNWILRGDVELPPTLVSLVQARLGTLPPSTADVLDVLAVGEPLELTALQRIVDREAIEDAEARGLVALERNGDGIVVRVAHPLYGEVRRRTGPVTRLRRLRGRVVADLHEAATGGRETVAMEVRRAGMMIDSDVEPDGELLVRAARGAVWLAGLPLADRLAGAAVRAGGGVEAYFVRAHVLFWLRRGDQADDVLASIPTIGFDSASHARLAFLRGVNKVFACGDPGSGKALVEEAMSAVPPPERSVVDAFLAVHATAMGDATRSRERSRGLPLDDMPDVVAAVTSWAMTLAAGESGHLTAALEAAESGQARTDTAYDAAPMRYVIADAHVGALLVAGAVERARAVAERLSRESVDSPSDMAQLASMAIAGRAALGAGRLDVARALLEPVVDVLVKARDANGWAYRFLLPLTSTLALHGAREEAEAALALADRFRHPGYANYDYEHQIARAWVAARQGVTSEAERICLDTAERARGRGQFGAAVLCLQYAVQFGDRSSAGRLAELSGIVEGPRASVACRLARAAQTGDGHELSAVSTAFEAMGDLVAAADAASLAAVAHRKNGLRGSASCAAARSEALRRTCGGIVTPAGAFGDDGVKLSAREHEIVALMADGLTNRLVAGRLSLSVRTVEGHVYRVMARTGARSRNELVAMLHGTGG